MMRQYKSIKARHPDAILFYHLGDFYEMFFDDAKTASGILQITLTARNSGDDGRVPMCGIPYSSADSYIARLVQAGHKVALCDQLGDPKNSKGLVDRSVVRVVTPGTVVEGGLLNPKEASYLAAVYRSQNELGLAVVEVSTGEFYGMNFPRDNPGALEDELARLRPKELILPESLHEESGFLSRGLSEAGAVMALPDLYFSKSKCLELIREQFGEHFLTEAQLGEAEAPMVAAGGVLFYLKETQRRPMDHLVRLRIVPSGSTMALDGNTLRNLELVQNLRDGGVENTLFEALDLCRSPAGSRLMRHSITNPLMNLDKIQERQDSIEEFRQGFDRLEGLRRSLSPLVDMSRIMGRLGCRLGSPKDLAGLRDTLEKIPALRELLDGVDSPRLEHLRASLDDVPGLREDLGINLAEDPPFTVKDGGVIREGASKDLDELRKASRGGKSFLAEYQSQERIRTGINTLKVKFNNIHGYFLEITKQYLNKVPTDYVRRSTLANAERFITPTLKEKEELIRGADEKALRLESRLWEELRQRVSDFAPQLQRTAEALAELDMLAAVAHLANVQNLVMPEVDGKDRIEILQGRHPVLDQGSGEAFVPNDLSIGDLDGKSSRLMILTGPNMAGKSTYMRQNALIVLMAQAGFPVPAKRAQIGLVDRIFTRVGASDNLAGGQSTFMVEMTETAHILHNATRRSLVLLDEVGRGTSTFDGISIAWAVAEDISKRSKAKTLFATHYFELTELARQHENITNASMAVREWNDKIVFLRKVEEGAADRSYGIHVARLAGLPKPVLERAREILSDLEQGSTRRSAAEDRLQGSLFENVAKNLASKIALIDCDNMTPLEALEVLHELKREAELYGNPSGNSSGKHPGEPTP